MADIAFLLLIFFLVTTTMSTNTGIQRKLPPFDPDSNIVVIPERDLLIVLINRDNNIALNGKQLLLKDVTNKTKEFFSNPYDLETLPGKIEKDIPFIGKYHVSRGVVSLQTDRNTSYKKYLQVQNELVRAINEMRNDLSLEKFNIAFHDLDKDKQDAICEAVPLAISEAEPRRIITADK